MKPNKPRDDRRNRFALEYAKDQNATQAAIRAGYSLRTAKQQGSRLLSKADVRASVQEILTRITERSEITIERTQREIARLAFGDRRKMYDERGALKLPHEMDDDTAALLSSLEVDEIYQGSGEERALVGYTRKVKTWDKGKALEQCMSILGMHKSASVAEAGGLSLSISLSRGGKLK